MNDPSGFVITPRPGVFERPETWKMIARHMAAKYLALRRPGGFWDAIFSDGKLTLREAIFSVMGDEMDEIRQKARKIGSTCRLFAAWDGFALTANPAAREALYVAFLNALDEGEEACRGR